MLAKENYSRRKNFHAKAQSRKVLAKKKLCVMLFIFGGVRTLPPTGVLTRQTHGCIEGVAQIVFTI